MRNNLESMCNKNTEAHTGHIKHPLCHNKTHREEEVGCRNKRQDNQRKSLKEKDKKNIPSDNMSHPMLMQASKVQKS